MTTRLKEIETLFSIFFTERNHLIEEKKKLAMNDKDLFLLKYEQCSLNFRILITFIFSCIRSYNRITIITNIENGYHEFLEKREISRIISTWNHAKQKANFIYRQLLSESACLYYSESRDILDSVSLDVFNSTKEYEFNVMVDGITNYFQEGLTEHLVDDSGSAIVIQDEKTKENYTLLNEIHVEKNYFQIGESRIYVPKKFIFVKGDKIFIKFRKSFFYKDAERTFITGSHVNTIETQILDTWIHIFNMSPSFETFESAYEETTKLLELILNITQSNF